MNLPTDRPRKLFSRRLLVAGPLLALSLPAFAQRTDAPASGNHAHGATHPAAKVGDDPQAMHDVSHPASASSTHGTDHAHLPGMKPTRTAPAESAVDHPTMHGMPKAAAPAATHAHGDVTPTPMSHTQSAAAPLGMRSPDYSDGIGRSEMPGMHMLDNQALAMLRVDQLEATHGPDANGQAWAVQGWYGNDDDKLWLRSDGERQRGRIGHAQVELLWDHAVAPFWDTQLGLRRDLGDGPQRQWAAFGIQGMAPYWFALEATAYVGPSGRTAARLHVEYELLFSQRLILQPAFELNLHGRNDAATRTGSGLSDTRFSLRLRYEVRREFAPYAGVVWIHRYGTSADYARQDGGAVTDRQFVAGVRFWF
jgi:copper resistance protein B